MEKTKKKLIVRIAEGLGNQLFMYANGYALSKKYNCDLYIDDTSGYFKKKNKNRNYELDNFNFSLLKFKAKEFIQYLKPVGFGPSGNTCPK